MISERELKRVSSLTVLNRARTIVARGYSIYDRQVAYDGPRADIRATVESSSNWNVVYYPHVAMDEKLGRILSYGCTCPISESNPAPCKHAMALVMDYNQNAGSYEGYHPNVPSKTTPSLAAYLAREQRTPVTEAEDEAAREGTVRLEPTLQNSYGTWLVRFKIASPHSSYVLKSIDGLLDDIDNRSWHSYGQKLAFTHDLQAFDGFTQRLVAFLRRSRDVRQSAAHEYRGGLRLRTERDLILSPTELSDLLDICEGHDFDVQIVGVETEQPLHGRVVDGNPSIALDIRPLEYGGYEVVRSNDVRFIDCGGTTLWGWEGGTFYRCTPELHEVADFLTSVYSDNTEHVVVAEADLPVFCATVLPHIEKRIPTQAPDELASLRPQPCTIAFYLDRDANGVTVDARATYGDDTYGLFDDDRPPALTRDIPRENAARQAVLRYIPSGRTANGARAASAGGSRYGFGPSSAGLASSTGFGASTADGPVFGGSGGSHARTRADLATPADARTMAPDAGIPRIPDKDSDAIGRLIYEGVNELQRLGQVFTTPSFDRLMRLGTPSVAVGLSIHSNLIDLTLHSEGFPASEMYALLNSYREKKRFHRLKSGAFVDLRNADLDEAAQLTDELGLTATQVDKGDVQLPAYRAFLVDDLVDDGEKDQTFTQWLEDFHTIDPDSYQVPAHLANVLRPYQVQGYRWLSSLIDLNVGGILADEMGLGKSLQVICTLFAHRTDADGRRSLIVCPASLVYNWRAEFERFAPQMDVAVVAGNRIERAEIRDNRDHEVLITSYDLLKRDIGDYQDEVFYCEVLDEAQFIKNHATQTARAVKAVDAAHRFALTGTPIENRLSELWSIFDYLMPGLLGSYNTFRERFEQPIFDGDEDVANHLQAAVKPFVLRRLKRDVLRDLPDKLESVVYARMTGKQRDLYDANEQRLRKSLQKEDDRDYATGKIQVLAELMRLRQICCDPGLLYENYHGPSSKVDTIEDLIDQSIDAQKKTLVFSQFTSFLDIIAKRLDEKGVRYMTITGATPKKRRVELVDTFNTDDTPVFLISLKAGGTGLNLTGASVVIHADPWWNAAAEDQATDRAHRIGQHQDVNVYKVIEENTIEERIVKLQQEKSRFAEQIIGADNVSITTLSKDDLIALLSD
jgi:superfamily II DNA or RNA helicase